MNKSSLDTICYYIYYAGGETSIPTSSKELQQGLQRQFLQHKHTQLTGRSSWQDMVTLSVTKVAYWHI